MRATYDQKCEAIELCKTHPASMVKELLGLTETERTIQRWTHAALGSRPTHRALERREPLRVRVVAQMVAGGLDEHYCSVCLRRSYRPCLIRELARDLDVGSLVFVCRGCTQPGDC